MPYLRVIPLLVLVFAWTLPSSWLMAENCPMWGGAMQEHVEDGESSCGFCPVVPSDPGGSHDDGQGGDRGGMCCCLVTPAILSPTLLFADRTSLAIDAPPSVRIESRHFTPDPPPPRDAVSFA